MARNSASTSASASAATAKASPARTTSAAPTKRDRNATKTARSSSSSSSSSSPSSGLQFPLLVVINLVLSVALYSIIPNLAGYELATVSRSLNEPSQLFARVAIKIAELGVAWHLGLDGYDFGSLLVLYSAPYYFLLYFFYDIGILAITTTLLIDLAANVTPFYALRRLNPHNKLQALRTEDAILASLSTINLSTSALAACCYGLVVYTSLFTWIPLYLISNFDSLVTLERAHAVQFPYLVLASLPLGIAAKNFLFVPSIASPGVSREHRRAGAAAAAASSANAFDPHTATLWETLRHNLGFAAKSGVRSQMLVKRSAIVAVMTMTFSYTKIYGTVAGAETCGALAWGGVFASGGLLVGTVFVWIGDV